MPKSPGSLTTLRDRNRSLVLKVVHQRGTASRVDIARDTGLSRTTVSALVTELVASGTLTELTERAPAQGSGRPATLLSVNPAGGSLLGVHFAHDFVRVALSDLAGRILDATCTSLDMDHRPADALSHAGDSLRALAASASERVLGVGVALSGPTRQGHAVTSGGLLPHWAGIDVAQQLGDQLELPVLVGNDANLGAVAEWTWGAGRGVSNLIYVMVSEGVGAGLIIDNRLYEGSGGTAGELGHVVIEPHGAICRCGGRGCLETVAAIPALTAAMAQTRGGRTTLAEVLERAAAHDAGALRVMSDAGRAIGRALAGVCAVLDPELVIVGGKVGAAGESLLAGVRETLALGLPPAIGRGLRVVPGALGAEAEVLGAISLAGRATALPALLTDLRQ